jgi:hypothetical protein
MSLNPKYITNHKGERTEVILPVQEYEHLLEEMQILRARANRKDLLALSLDERDRILRQQAEEMIEFYRKDTKWRELDQIDDLYEYDK